MAATQRLPIRILAATVVASFMLSLTGCQNFFVCAKASCTTTNSSTGTGDYVYVSNSTAGSTYLNGYSVSAGTLSAISGFPVNLDFIPSALAITPNDVYLYAGVATTSTTSAGQIFGYTIGSAGNLNILDSGTALSTPGTGVSSLAISPDGGYLFALDSTIGELYEYQINTSTGFLTLTGSFPLASSGTITQQSVRVSPNGNFVVCALGTGGDVIFPYNSTSGITSSAYASINTNATTVGDYGIAIDTGNYLYIARTNGVAVYSITVNSSTSVTANLVTEPSLTIGNGPHSAALSSTAGGDVYIGNLTDGTISAYTSSSGVLANVSGTPFTGPTAVAALERDSSSKYIVAAGYNTSSGLQLFSIGSSGALSSLGSAGTGGSTSIPTAMAITH